MGDVQHIYTHMNLRFASVNNSRSLVLSEIDPCGLEGLHDYGVCVAIASLKIYSWDDSMIPKGGGIKYF